MVQLGLKAHIGAHGEPPLGLNYHAEMFFARLGGLTNFEVSIHDTVQILQHVTLMHLPYSGYSSCDVRRSEDARNLLRSGFDLVRQAR